MFPRNVRLMFTVFFVIVPAARLAWAEGFGLGETKEQLKLDYELSAVDHGTGRVTVHLTIADQGRLKPLDSVQFVIPGNDGTHFVDFSAALAISQVDGKQSATVHLKRDLAERAELQLRTSHLDGKQEPLTWYYHSIPIADYIREKGPKKN